MKSDFLVINDYYPVSRSREGAWIEIPVENVGISKTLVAPARERGLKYVVIHSGLKLQERRSREGAWIEINFVSFRDLSGKSSLPRGSVD